MNYIKFFLLLCLVVFNSCKSPSVTRRCLNTGVQPVLKELIVNQKDTIIVCAINPRNPSGILLKKGFTYSFEVIPNNATWRVGWLMPFTANGRIAPHFSLFHLFKRKVSVKWFALIGSVSNIRSTYFKIGIKRESFMPEHTGELICFANDVCGDYFYRHNNEGQLTVIITRTK